MKQYLEDCLAVLGVLLIVIGVWVQFGLGYALIIAGVLVLALAVLIAYKGNQNAPEKPAGTAAQG